MLALLAYAAFAAALLAISHRAVRPVRAAAAFVLVLMPLVFTGASLLTGRVYGPIDLPYRSLPLADHRDAFGLPPEPYNPTLWDLAFQIIPWRAAVQAELRAGEWPLWNPGILAGDPLAASAQPAPYHPVNLIAALLPLASGVTFAAAATFFLAALGGFAFLREVGCREGVALVGALGWMACDFMAFWVGWPLGLAVAGLPLVLAGVERVVLAPGGGAVGLLTAALALVLLAGHPESAAHVAGLGGIYGAARLLAPGVRRRRTLAAAIAAGLLALLLCALDVLPFTDALAQSAQVGQRAARAERIEQRAAWGEAGPRLLMSFAPFAYGRPGFRPQVPWPVTVQKVAGYAGTLLLPLAAFGLWRSRFAGRWALAALGLLGLFAGARAPVVAAALARLPPFDLAVNERLAFMWALAVVALGALGLEELVERGDRRRAALCCAAGLAVCGALLAAVWALAVRALPPPLMARHAALFLLPLAAGAAITSWRGSPRLALAAVGLLLVLQRWGESGRIYPNLPAATFYPRPGILALLPPADEPYRVAGLRFALMPNLATVWGLEDPRGYQALHLDRMARVLPLWSERAPAWTHTLPDLTDPLVSFLNVRYVLAPRDLPAVPGWASVGRRRGTKLLESSRVLPRAYVPPSVRMGGSRAQVLREMALETDFGQRAWIEEPGHAAGAAPREIANGPGLVATRRRGQGYEITAELASPGYVVTSITAWRGWRAASAGRRLPLAYANHAFLAFELPAGRHEVRLTYLPDAFVWGRGISLATAALIAVWAVGRRYRRRSASIASP